MNRLTTKTVPADGPLNAKICFVGEAPGAEEDTFMKPFIGSAGQLMNRCFREVGILREEVLVTNVFRQRPPKNAVSYFFEDAKCTKPTWEAQEHIDNLQKWLNDLREYDGGPNIIVALGATAMKVLTGKKRIEKWRGSILPCTLCEGYKVYPTYHPSYVMRMLNEQDETKVSGEKKARQVNAYPLFLRDLERIQIQAEFPEIRYPERNLLVNLSYSELTARLEYLASTSGMVAIDIETLPSEEGPLVWCIGFSEHPSEAFVVPILKNLSYAWSLEEEAKLWVLISKVFLNPRLKKIFQGGTYDLAVLGRYYGLRVADATYEDTMHCHFASYPYIKKGLEILCSIYTWEPYYKDEGKVHFGKRSSDQGEFLYNAKDCCVTREIFPVVARDSRELSTWDGYRRTQSVIPSLLGMMIRGVKIDIERKETLSDDYERQMLYHQREIERIAGLDNINLNSSPQKQKLLYYHLDLPVQYNRATRKPTADKEAIAKLRRQFPNNKILEHLAEYQKFSILKRTFADMLLDSDGRIRTSYNFVSTWRLNSSGSPFIFNLSKKKQAGGNLQNIPVRTDEGREIRKLFIGDDCPKLPDLQWKQLIDEVTSVLGPDVASMLINGRKAIACSDLSQAESRVVAWESEDLEDIQLYLEGIKDVHWERAKLIFKIPDSVPYNPKALYRDPITREEHPLKFYRDLGKRVVHATNYDMGPVKLQAILATDGVFLEQRVCRLMLESYKASKPQLSRWKREVRSKIKATRTIISSFGRKRQFLGRENDNLYRAAYAFSPQNTVGEMLEVAIQEIFSTIEEVDILLNIHDEVVYQVEPKDFLSSIPKIKSCMERELIIKGRPLTIPCDFKVGRSWGETVEFKWQS